MRSGTPRRARLLAATLLTPALLLTLGGCIFTQDAVVPLSTTALTGARPLKIDKAVKAHLDDGSVILFHEGFRVESGELRGTGEQFDFTRSRRTAVESVPLARVVALEAYQREPNLLPSSVGIVAGSLPFLLLLVMAAMMAPTW
ncbi:MAG TPA: hypothetical protein VN317_00820 [Candidatus Methanoperedens sp.]|nr:hypothetical protein [Candidatus Methanoperedens sp.]